MQDHISIFQIRYSASFKGMDGYAYMQHDACQDDQTSAAIMANFSDVEEQIADPYFSP